jgi:hypothetical protein
MSYKYETERGAIFTENGQKDFLQIRDKASKLLDSSGAFKSDNVLTGDCWFALACLDRLVELGELKEVTSGGRGQDRVFIRGEE